MESSGGLISGYSTPKVVLTVCAAAVGAEDGSVNGLCVKKFRLWLALTRTGESGRIERRPKGGHMGRVMADCRRFPSESNCSLVIIGEEDEVVTAAAEHAAAVHGHEDTPEMREQMRQFLEPADAYQAGPRAQEPLPS
jgi:predicted small metal-binding protein